MSNIILHIKDSYYFEVPKMLWRSNRQSVETLPDWLVRLDDDYQNFEAAKVVEGLTSMGAPSANVEGLTENWTHWKHSNKKYEGWPLDAYLDLQSQGLVARSAKWAKKNAPNATEPVKAYLAENLEKEPFVWFYDLTSSPDAASKWTDVKAGVDSPEFLKSYLQDAPGAKWAPEKLAFYNRSLDGKVLIPQPFGVIKNAYEPSSGFCISKYMIIQVVVAILLIAVLRWLGKKISTGDAPKGRLWNFLEGLLLFVRDSVVVPAMGEHDAKRFMPLLWTFFVFIFGLNLAGMIPWVGSPTAALATTGTFAIIVFAVGVYMGVRAFGAVGYLKNVCPELGLPWYLAFWVIPLLWVIEFASLFIKHAILAIRLLANMVAGHAVLLGIMGLAVGVHAYAMHTGAWGVLASASVIGMTALSVLELFVAFLQAAVFTFLAALFIGSSMHHH
ncbi:MAG: F0F1 ATP synthase subunit A [Pirellulaceae bacterium]|nr:F0F1 ATP synthase subunit A [Pirellulaceae bacterium]